MHRFMVPAFQDPPLCSRAAPFFPILFLCPRSPLCLPVIQSPRSLLVSSPSCIPQMYTYSIFPILKNSGRKWGVPLPDFISTIGILYQVNFHHRNLSIFQQDHKTLDLSALVGICLVSRVTWSPLGWPVWLLGDLSVSCIASRVTCLASWVIFLFPKATCLASRMTYPAL